MPKKPNPNPDAAGDVVVVTCPVAGGRRRAGRRWQAGETRVPAAELTADEIAQLKADPLLRVDLEAS